MKHPQRKMTRLLLATLMFVMGGLSSCSKNTATSSSSGGASIAGTPAQFYSPERQMERTASWLARV